MLATRKLLELFKTSLLSSSLGGAGPVFVGATQRSSRMELNLDCVGKNWGKGPHFSPYNREEFCLLADALHLPQV